MITHKADHFFTIGAVPHGGRVVLGAAFLFVREVLMGERMQITAVTLDARSEGLLLTIARTGGLNRSAAVRQLIAEGAAARGLAPAPAVPIAPLVPNRERTARR